MYPEQFDPTKPFELVADKVPDSGGRSLAERVSAKLGREDQLITDFGAPILGATLHQELGGLWRDAGEITVGELWGYFTRYTYLPRLVRREVLDQAITQSLSTVLVENERFAIASGRDPESNRYRALIVPPSTNASIQITNSTLLVEVDRAQRQVEADRIVAAREEAESGTSGEDGTGSVGAVDFVLTDKTLISDGVETSASESGPEDVLARFFGSVKIDSNRYARDIGNVTREVIDRLAGAGANLEITIDIQATKSDGFDESEVRTIGENARVLKFDPSSGFEKN